MTQKLPRARGIEVVKAFKKAGWRVDRIEGSHYIIIKEKEVRFKVVVGLNKDIFFSCAIKILKDLVKIRNKNCRDQKSKADATQSCCAVGIKNRRPSCLL